ncbi:MAG: response regulator transcription factor [Planctomycetota bacterium]
MSDARSQLPAVPLITRNQWLYIQRKYALSPRELEVAELVCQGLTNSQIAADLQVKTGTVKTHLKGIFNKTRRRSKIALLLKFLEDVNELVSKSPKAGRVAIVEVTEPGKKTPAQTTMPKQKE